MWDDIRTLPQHILPQHFLSRCMYHLTRSRWPAFKNALIKSFIATYRVDMQSAEQESAEQFACFNEFFTRALKPEARTVDQSPGSVTSPVDGTISQVGKIEDGRIFQAKGKSFDLASLLARESDESSPFENGHFCTIYLSPRDYHRIHAPCDAVLASMDYVPGRLFSVNESTTNSVNELFARNERLLCHFDSSAGSMVVVFVGAIFVGNMQTTWHGEVNPSDSSGVSSWEYDVAGSNKLTFKKGEEIGRFNMGSTVILLFENGQVNWDEEMRAGRKVQMGERLGYRP